MFLTEVFDAWVLIWAISVGLFVAAVALVFVVLDILIFGCKVVQLFRIARKRRLCLLKSTRKWRSSPPKNFFNFFL